MWKLIFVLTFHLDFGTTDFMHGPRNTVVSVGQRLEMTCHAPDDSTIREWSMKRPFTSKKEPIFETWKGRKQMHNPHFLITGGADGGSVLATNSTELSDAGIYNCTVQKVGGQPVRYSAHLIVFETDPICEANFSNSQSNIFEEGTNIWMRCTINFTGNWAPSLEWRLHEGPTFDVFNAIYLVAGVAILFGITSSLIALILCLRRRRTNSVAKDSNKSTEPVASEYNLRPYAITESDVYDTIDEVGEKEDILVTNLAHRQGTLSSYGYSGLTPEDPKPPGVYSRMDHQEKTAENDGSKPRPDLHSSENSYLDLEPEVNVSENIAPECQDIPSAYLQINDISLH